MRLSERWVDDRCSRKSEIAFVCLACGLRPGADRASPGREQTGSSQTHGGEAGRIQQDCPARSLEDRQWQKHGLSIGIDSYPAAEFFLAYGGARPGDEYRRRF